MTNSKKTPFLKRAIDIARQNMASGGGPFGAVIVKDNRIIAESGNQVTTHNDPTAHAEIEAIRLAASNTGTFDLSGCTLYASCEPCPMCLGAIYWARLDALYFAGSRDDAADAGFDDDFIYKEIAQPIEKRKIPASQSLQAEAREVFNQWKNLEEKTRY